MNASYNVAVIDIGSPKLGNLGWCLIETDTDREYTGVHLDELFPLLPKILERKGMLLGLEAPLFVPIRDDLMKITKGRLGESRRPWSAGAGAQVLALNLPIMVYLFEGIKKQVPSVDIGINETNFLSKPNQVAIFEALVSGSDKGSSHIEDATIMARSCANYGKRKKLPSSILEDEEGTRYFNLAAAALIRVGLINQPDALHQYSSIYKPENSALP